MADDQSTVSGDFPSEIEKRASPRIENPKPGVTGDSGLYINNLDQYGFDRDGLFIGSIIRNNITGSTSIPSKALSQIYKTTRSFDGFFEGRQDAIHVTISSPTKTMTGTFVMPARAVIMSAQYTGGIPSPTLTGGSYKMLNVTPTGSTSFDLHLSPYPIDTEINVGGWTNAVPIYGPGQFYISVIGQVGPYTPATTVADVNVRISPVTETVQEKMRLE